MPIPPRCRSRLSRRVRGHVELRLYRVVHGGRAECCSIRTRKYVGHFGDSELPGAGPGYAGLQRHCVICSTLNGRKHRGHAVARAAVRRASFEHCCHPRGGYLQWHGRHVCEQKHCTWRQQRGARVSGRHARLVGRPTRPTVVRARDSPDVWGRGVHTTSVTCNMTMQPSTYVAVNCVADPPAQRVTASGDVSIEQFGALTCTATANSQGATTPSPGHQRRSKPVRRRPEVHHCGIGCRSEHGADHLHGTGGRLRVDRARAASRGT